MKILLTSNYAPPHGGVAITVNNIAKYLSQSKHEVTIASFEVGFKDLKDCKVIQYTGIKFLNDFLFWPWEAVQLFLTIQSQDVVFIHTPYFVISNVAALFGKVLGKKVICMSHGPIFIDWRNTFHLPFINKLIDKWLFLNKENRAFLGRYVPMLKPSVFVSNGIELNEYRPRKPVTKVQKFIFVGRLEKEKGIEEFINIAKTFPRFSFGCIGDGVYKAELQKLNNVTCYGYLPHIEVIKIMKEYDCLLSPSRVESFGLTILEARALGLTIITTNCNSNTMNLVGSAGVVVPIGDIKALEKAVVSSDDIKPSIQNLRSYDRKEIIKTYEKELFGK